MTRKDDPYIDLCCPGCGWTETCDPDAVVKWLRVAGRLRRDQQPELDVMHEVLRAAAPELPCPDCNHLGVLVTATAEADAEWTVARCCDRCGEPIPRVRLDAIPNANMCASCQQADEHGEGPIEVDYCPRCGSPMAMKLAGGAGVARYVMKCTGQPPCR